MNGCDCACHHGYGGAHVGQTCWCKPGGDGYRTVADAEAVDLATLAQASMRGKVASRNARRRPARRR